MLDFNNAERQLTQTEIEAFEKIMNNRAAKITTYMHMYPDAQQCGSELVTGDINGSPGRSTGYNVDKDIIKDFKAGDSGTLVSAWANKYNTNKTQAVIDIIKFNHNSHSQNQSNGKPVWLKEPVDKKQPKQKTPANITKEIVYTYYNSSKTKILQTIKRIEYDNGKKDFKVNNPSAIDPKDRYKAPEIRPMYNLPGIKNKQTIVYVEGEKCADALIEAGYPATCINGGANADINKVDWSHIAGKEIVIWPDNDTTGINFARNLRDHLERINCRVKIIDIPTGKPAKWDSADASIEEVKGLLDPVMNIPAFQFFTMSDIVQIEIAEKPIAHGFMYEHDPVVIHGKGGEGKTTLTEDIATYLASIDHQTPDVLNPLRLWGLFQVDRAFSTLFLQTENGIGPTQKRAKMRAYKNRPYQLAQNRIYYPNINNNIMMGNCKITDHGFYQWMKDLISHIEDTRCQKIDIVVFDPLISFVDGDENDSVKMRTALDRINMAASECKFTPVVIHHDKKDGHEYRGSSAILDWARSMIGIKREFRNERVLKETESGEQIPGFTRVPVIKVEHKKSNNFEPFKPFYLKLNSRTLSYDLYSDKELPDPKATQGLIEVSEAIFRMGGTAESQSELVDEILLFKPDVTRSSIKKQIQRSVDRGFLVEICHPDDDRRKKYRLSENFD